jgi:hypothetical protein
MFPRCFTLPTVLAFLGLIAFTGCNSSTGGGKKTEEECTITSFGQKMPCSVWEDFQNLNRPKTDSTIQREIATGQAIFWDSAEDLHGEALFGHRLVFFHDSLYSLGGDTYNGTTPNVQNLTSNRYVPQGPDYLPYISHFNTLVRNDTVFAIGGQSRSNLGSLGIDSAILFSTDFRHGWDTLPGHLQGNTHRGSDLFQMGGYYYTLGGHTFDELPRIAEDTSAAAFRSADLVHWERYGTSPGIYLKSGLRAFTADGYAYVHSVTECFRSRDFQTWDKVRLANGADSVQWITLMFKHKDRYIILANNGSVVYATPDFATYTRKFIYDRPGRAYGFGDNYLVARDTLYTYSSFSASSGTQTVLRKLALNRLE